MNKRVFSLLLAACLLASSLPPVLAVQEETDPPSVQEAGADFTVSSPEDWAELARLCALDTWSQGKTVVLTGDVDLSDSSPIPTFGGVFLGGGHTLKNWSLTAAGSDQGLFRYLQPGAQVRDLTVEGLASPEGTRSTVGGVVGVNGGTVTNCVFRGSVTGGTAVGGIAGRNAVSGEIAGCAVYGSVSGESLTGGIAGRNQGLLLKCENHAGINLTDGESDRQTADLEEELEEDLETGSVSSPLRQGGSDAGGIAGFSEGMIQSCVNHGDVGYPHVGYNIGGIAGRQRGGLSGCVNHGHVQGRKDVGGIVGQAEPDVAQAPGRDTLERLRAETDTLEDMIQSALDDAQSLGDTVSARLDAMGTHAGDAKDSAKAMLDHLSDFTDGTVGSVNTLLADITDALDRVTPALDDLADAGRRLEKLSRQLEDAVDALGDASNAGEAILRDIRAALRDLRQAGGHLSGTSGDLRDALEEFLRGLISGGGDQEEARQETSDSLEALSGAFAETAAGADRLSAALSQAEGIPQDLPSSLEDAARALEEVSGVTEDFSGRLTLDALRNAGLDHLLERLQATGRDLESALSAIQRAADRSDSLSEALRDALDGAQDASVSAAAIGRLLYSAFDAISGAVRQLTRDPVEFTPMGEDFRQASDDLYSAAGGLLEEMTGLNDDLDRQGDVLSGDLRSVSRQVNRVLDLLIDALSDAREDWDAGLEGMVRDTSEEDIAAVRLGKIADSRSDGPVEGDRNVGGVAGAVAMEFDLDPEDDAAEDLSFGVTYETKAVLLRCANYGAVTAKKDCAGGIAGRMDLGTALECESYGPVSSTGGDNVGGVAGWADASIRSCYAKVTLSGRDCVGGIAGWAGRLRDCCAMTVIQEGRERLGAVAGFAEEGAVLENNRFVDTGLAGVDGVSYTGHAEPIAFAELQSLPDIPTDFTAFTLTLTADGEVVARLPFLYGDDLSRLTLPPVPEKEGHYGRWPDFDVSGVLSDITAEAVYAPWITLAASEEVQGKQSLALAEGRFTDEAVLHVLPCDQAPPEEAGRDPSLWTVTLTGTAVGPEDPLTLRLLSPRQDQVWQYSGGQWRPLEAARNGSYLVVQTQGPEGTFCLRTQAELSWLLPVVLLAAALAVLVLGFGRRKIRKKNGKKEANNTPS